MLVTPCITLLCGATPTIKIIGGSIRHDDERCQNLGLKNLRNVLVEKPLKGRIWKGKKWLVTCGRVILNDIYIKSRNGLQSVKYEGRI